MINTSLPEHQYGFVRNEFLYNLESGYGEFTPAVIFGISSHPHRALAFHVMLETGAVFWRLPIHALTWKSQGVPLRPLTDLEDWDAFSEYVGVHTFDYLREQRIRTRCAGEWCSGLYVTTIDWIRR